MFDLIAWGIGFGLRKGADRLIEELSPSALSTELDQEVRVWSSQLPKSFDDLVPTSILTKLFSQPDVTTETNSRNRQALQESIELRKVPSADLWYAALFERWSEVRTSLGGDAQTFFKANEATVEPFLRDLSTRLFRVCTRDTKLFRASIYNLINEMYTKIQNIEKTLEKSASENSLVESIPDALTEMISLSPNNAPGHNVALGRTLRTDATFILQLMFYLRVRRADTLRRLDVRYFVGNSDRLYPAKAFLIAINGEEQKVDTDGILERLYDMAENRWYSFASKTVFWGLDFKGNIVSRSHPEFGSPIPPQDGTDYGRGEIVLELMKTRRTVPFYLNPGGKILLSPEEWRGPMDLID